MPWRKVKHTTTCLGCGGTKGSWQRIYEPGKRNPTTTWVSCGVCGGTGTIEITVEEWYKGNKKDE